MKVPRRITAAEIAGRSVLAGLVWFIMTVVAVWSMGFEPLTAVRYAFLPMIIVQLTTALMVAAVSWGEGYKRDCARAAADDLKAAIEHYQHVHQRRPHVFVQLHKVWTSLLEER